MSGISTTEHLRDLFVYTHTHAVRDHETQKAFILEALQAYGDIVIAAASASSP